MWLLDKVRSSSEDGTPPSASLSTSLSGQAAPFANILTPDRIPEFCIPPRLAPVSPPSRSPGSGFVPHRCLTETGLQAKEPFLPHLIQVESVEEEEEEEEDGTNSDPRSQAALSLPHFQKAQTSYGFCTLLESPHTRRKESIFHREGLDLGLSLPRSRSSSYSGRELTVPTQTTGPRFGSYSGRELTVPIHTTGPIAVRSLQELTIPTHTTGLRSGSYSGRELTVPIPTTGPIAVHSLQRQSQCVWDSDTTVSSTDSSPIGSPRLGQRWGSLFKALSHDGLLKSKSNGVRTGRTGSLSADESGSSTDSSPNATRRSSESLCEPSPRSYSVSALPVFPIELERLSRESVIHISPAAIVRLSSDYCPHNRRLRVRLISAEGLYPPSADPKGIHCCVSFALMPGKAQKQRSTGIKRSRNPIFKEDFFFVGLAEDDLYDFALRIKAVNKGSGVKRDLVLAESRVALHLLLAA
ncbi:C2 calcium-dependent domain-containing protein 4C [Anolis carolinensis]|uniref:C2 domain-containing protein n=1 Tax=Anolis carolinensis TaxID=28377 RepID=A0A803TPK4_ANOCA|nr:PREDICTED: C2 calcium-dependent domain-containing protein 4C-like [Anolis carolinensis]|eukprot:XP_008123932.1 PREDICTED: C2 calcium-dependent domain-containing protein 4C-like [Anolis carolinensis]